MGLGHLGIGMKIVEILLNHIPQIRAEYKIAPHGAAV